MIYFAAIVAVILLWERRRVVLTNYSDVDSRNLAWMYGFLIWVLGFCMLIYYLAELKMTH